MHYEILLRGNEDGTLSGGHSIQKAGGLPQPISEAEWPEVCESINAAALAKVDELEAKVAELTGENDSLRAQLQTSVSV